MFDGLGQSLKHALYHKLAVVAIYPENTYVQRTAAPFRCHAALGKVCQHLFAFHGISKEFKARRTCRVLQHEVEDRDHGKECRVHGKPISTSQNTLLAHLGCNVDDVAGDADAGGSAGESPWVDCFLGFGLGHIVEEWTVEQELGMSKSHAEHLLYTATLLARFITPAYWTDRRIRGDASSPGLSDDGNSSSHCAKSCSSSLIFEYATVYVTESLSPVCGPLIGYTYLQILLSTCTIRV
jgi:hypothetical protein